MKPFEEIISVLPIGVIKEINKMDTYLKSLPTLKFKRMVDKKSGKIGYVSANYGVSYSIKLKNNHQEFGWYFIHDKQNGWYRKTDYMVNVFNNINPDIAERLFNSFMECTFCRDVNDCGRLSYEYKGKKKMTHYGRVVLGLQKNDFDDVKEFCRSLEVLCKI
jgi:hypothetical protein